jgi:hypothetical protein
MSKFENNMAEIFDVIPTEKTPAPVPIVIENKESNTMESDLDDDYNAARKNLKDLVSKGNVAIEQLMAIATDTEHPRAFEVVATLIKNTAEANEKLLMIQRETRNMKGLNNKSASSSVNVDKAIFVGSTSELSKLIKGKRDDNI